MKNAFKKFCVSIAVSAAILISPFSVTVQAATAPSSHVHETAQYAAKASYVANWGDREEECTSLSSYATAFYTGSYVYDTLSLVNGGTSQSNAPSSSLYKSLQSLMQSKHKTITTYG